MSELREKQSRFAHGVGLLIAYAESLDYQVTLGETYRSDEQAEINALGVTGREHVAKLIEATASVIACTCADSPSTCSYSTRRATG
jgi:hypothetical protein